MAFKPVRRNPVTGKFILEFEPEEIKPEPPPRACALCLRTVPAANFWSDVARICNHCRIGPWLNTGGYGVAYLDQAAIHEGLSMIRHLEKEIGRQRAFNR